MERFAAFPPDEMLELILAADNSVLLGEFVEWLSRGGEFSKGALYKQAMNLIPAKYCAANCSFWILAEAPGSWKTYFLPSWRRYCDKATTRRVREQHRLFFEKILVNLRKDHIQHIRECFSHAFLLEFEEGLQLIVESCLFAVTYSSYRGVDLYCDMLDLDSRTLLHVNCAKSWCVLLKYAPLVCHLSLSRDGKLDPISREKVFHPRINEIARVVTLVRSKGASLIAALKIFETYVHKSYNGLEHIFWVPGNTNEHARLKALADAFARAAVYSVYRPEESIERFLDDIERAFKENHGMGSVPLQMRLNL